MSDWDKAEPWYNECVGEKGHYYHSAMILEKALHLLNLKKGDSLLDLGCGQGVLERHLPPGISYCGIDNSKALISSAKKRSKAEFIIADVSKPLPLQNRFFDAAIFILSLQNMENPEQAIAQAATHLKPEGKLLIILNHPAFRIPRQSHWGIDEQTKIQYRRMNLYMTPQKIPIQTHPGKGEKSSTTYTFHHPLSSYITWGAKNHLFVSACEEWISDKKSSGPKAKMEDRARREFPLFLALLYSVRPSFIT